MKANRRHMLGWLGQHCWNQAKGGRGFARSFGRAAVLAVVATYLFAATAVAQTYDVLHNFNSSGGAHPWARLIQGMNGYLYGTAAGGGYGGDPNDYGAIFKIDTTGTFTTLHTFVNSDGAYPQAGLIQGIDGYLYGTTVYGGPPGSCTPYGCGTIFKIDTSGTFTTLHNFAGSDGKNPYAGLIQGSDGNLYGTTYLAGASGYGTIFKIDTNGTQFTTLHNFVNSDGAGPLAGLIQATDGNLYGTTTHDASGYYGTIFKMDTSGSTLTTLHNFAGSDGADPEEGGLIQGTDGNLYGTTYGGGPGSCYAGCGTLFKIGTDGTRFTTLHNFAGSDGAKPNGGVIQGTDGNLYGTTANGGAGSCTNGCGTVFKIDISGSALAILHSFAGSDGRNPYAGLIQARDGNLYGTTVNGGANGGGVVFRAPTVTQTPTLTNTPKPTNTPTPTNTPKRKNIPKPTATPTP